MRNTIRKVTMVVPVLMTSCQVSEKWNTGPVTAQMTSTAAAMMKAHGLPTRVDTLWENLRNTSLTGPSLSCWAIQLEDCALRMMRIKQAGRVPYSGAVGKHSAGETDRSATRVP